MMSSDIAIGWVTKKQSVNTYAATILQESLQISELRVQQSTAV